MRAGHSLSVAPGATGDAGPAVHGSGPDEGTGDFATIPQTRVMGAVGRRLGQAVGWVGVPVTRSCRSGAAGRLFPARTGRAGSRRDDRQQDTRGPVRDTPSLFPVLNRPDIESHTWSVRVISRSAQHELSP